MASGLLAVAFIGLTIIAVVRNFFVQMISFKLTLDAIFLFLAYFNQQQQVMLAVGWIMMAVGMLIIFLMMIVSLKKLSVKNDLNAAEDGHQ